MKSIELTRGQHTKVDNDDLEAVKMYNKVAKNKFGEFARLNEV